MKSARIATLGLISCIALLGCGGGASNSGGNGGGTVSTASPTTPTITISPAAPVSGQSVNFSGAATDPGALAITYSWDFGDSSSLSAGSSVTKTYAKAGTYTVTLTATNTAGKAATGVATLTIAAAPPNTPVITPSLTTALTGQAVSLTGLATDPANLSLTYSWDYGDGTTGTGATVSKLFSKAGSFTVSLSATNSAGKSASSTVVLTIAWAQPTKAWTKRIGQYGTTSINDIAVQQDGTPVIIGSTCCGTLQAQQSIGSEDAFLTKIDSTGAFGLTKVFGSTNIDVAKATITSSDGSIYVAGETAAASIDGQQNSSSPCTGTGVFTTCTKDGFISKFSSSGGLIWTRLLGGVGDDTINDIGLASDGFIYLVGTTRSATIDGASTNGSTDAFITKLAPDGTKVWTKTIGGTGADSGDAVSLASDGSIFIAGSTTSSLLEGNVKSDMNPQEAFFTKLSPDGAKALTKVFGGGYEWGLKVAGSSDGFIYLAGHTGSSTMDGIVANTGDTSGDVFLTKYALTGTRVWTKIIGGSGSDDAGGLAIGSDGAIYLAGTTSGYVLDGAATNGSSDIFVTKYVSDGTRAWTYVTGGTGSDVATALAVGTNGSIFITGTTRSANVDGQAAIGNWDSIVIKYTQ